MLEERETQPPEESRIAAGRPYRDGKKEAKKDIRCVSRQMTRSSCGSGRVPQMRLNTETFGEHLLGIEVL